MAISRCHASEKSLYGKREPLAFGLIPERTIGSMVPAEIGDPKFGHLEGPNPFIGKNGNFLESKKRLESL